MKKYETHYGSNSLKTWVNMMLTGANALKLPKYQRSFVWTLDRSKKLIESINEGLFIPPVTYAMFTGAQDVEAGIYIIDGQQRLTSILLFHLGFWWEDGRNILEEDDEDIVANTRGTKEWTFESIQKIYNTLKNPSVDNLRKQLEKEGYFRIESMTSFKDGKVDKKLIESAASISKLVDDDFLANHELGFSYIDTLSGNSEDGKKLFANIFRNINTTSVGLSHEETRAAFYWIRPKLVEFFKPDFLRYCMVAKEKLDFARYLAIVSPIYDAYLKKESIKNIPSASYSAIARGYANKLNVYVMNYVSDIVESEKGKRGLAASRYMENMPKFESAFKTLFGENLGRYRFDNSAVAETYLCGLIFWVLFAGCRIDFTKAFTLKGQLEKLTAHQKSDDKLSGIRERLKQSIELFEGYVRG
ncbi:hypothetical protein RsTz2092_02400 [Deferribacterales bacterium RsTz2092]|nr:hypothetical protein AGMMS49941_08400 [Deferribacterales bacterium]